MKRFLQTLGLMTLAGPLFAGQGLTGSLTVSSGTFKAIQGFNNNLSNFVQAIAVVDSSYPVTAPVDGLRGMAVYLTTSTQFQGVDLSTGVQVNPGAAFLGVDHSTGVQVNTGGRFLGIDLSSGVKSNQGNAGAQGWFIDLSTGVKANQGTAGTSFWGVDHSTGVQVNTGGRFLGVDLSTGVQINGTVTANQGTPNARFPGVDLSTGVQVNGSLSDNGVAAATNRVGIVPSIYQTDYLNGTGATQGRNGALTQGTDGLLWTASLPALRPSAFTASTGTVTSAASATDIAGLCGNASNTVLLYAMRVSCTQTTAGNINLTIIKRTSADVGLFSTMTVTNHDTNYSGPVSTATWYGTNPSALGTFSGYLDNYKIGCMAAATATPNDIYMSPADWKMLPIVLRGTAQCVYVNLDGVTVSGGSFSTTFNWLETKTITP